MLYTGFNVDPRFFLELVMFEGYCRYEHCDTFWRCSGSNSLKHLWWQVPTWQPQSPVSSHTLSSAPFKIRQQMSCILTICRLGHKSESNTYYHTNRMYSIYIMTEGQQVWCHQASSINVVASWLNQIKHLMFAQKQRTYGEHMGDYQGGCVAKILRFNCAEPSSLILLWDILI